MVNSVFGQRFKLFVFILVKRVIFVWNDLDRTIPLLNITKVLNTAIPSKLNSKLLLNLFFLFHFFHNFFLALSRIYVLNHLLVAFEICKQGFALEKILVVR